MKLNKLFHFIPFVIGLLLMTTVFTGCSDDDDELQQTPSAMCSSKSIRVHRLLPREQKREAPTCWISWTMPRKSRW